MRPPVLLCTGFHRSATSYTANWLGAAGLSLGRQLLPAHQSNPDGHFEDGRVVRLHDQWLGRNGSSWQFHGEHRLREDEALRESIAGYIGARDAEGVWAFKDPRSCLSINAWHAELGERGRYLFVVRHWAECAQSLFQRHSRALAYRLPRAEIAAPHLRFWVQPELAYAMWLAYNRVVLQFVQAHPEQSLVVTARGVTSKMELPRIVESRLRIPVCGQAPKPHIRSASNPGRVNGACLLPRSESLTAELDQLWMRLLQHSALRSEDESIECIFEPASDRSQRMTDLAELTAVVDTDDVAATPPPAPWDMDVLRKELADIPISGRLRAVLSRARQQASAGRPRDAVELLQWAMDQLPDAAQLLGAMGEVEEGAGKPEAALACFIAALDKGARAVDAVRCSRMLMALQRHQEAETLLIKASGRHPGHAGIAVQYARCLLVLERPADAAAVLSNIVEHDPTSLDLLAQLTFHADYEAGLRLSLEAVRMRLAGIDREAWLRSALGVMAAAQARQAFISSIHEHWVKAGLGSPPYLGPSAS